MEILMTALMIFCIATCVSLAVDFVKEGKSFRFGLAIAGAIYTSLLMNEVLFC